MSSLTSLTVTEMREGLLKKDFSASELVASHIQRIKKTNPEFNSFITVTAEHAAESAKSAEKRLLSENDKSPLLTGIPVGIKDMIITKGIETTCASKMLKGFIPPYDATVIERLKNSDAVILGKTNLDEFAMGSSNELSAFGPVLNPWDKTRVPGGTSGGSAVAVSLGQAALCLGTDTGGSIRQPASLTGVVGLKPTYGRVSRYGAVAHASSFDQIGPLGRTVKDVAIMLETIAGEDEHDSTCMRESVPRYYRELCNTPLKSLKGLRVGVPKQYFIDGMEPEVEKSVRNALETLKQLGATLIDISLPHTEYALPVYYIIVPAEAASNLARYDGIRFGNRAPQAKTLNEVYEMTRGQNFGSEVKRRIMMGNYVLSAGYYDAYYIKAQQVRTLIIDDFRAAFHNHCDIIAAPASPTTAFKIGEKSDDPLALYLADIFTVPLNLAGLPALSLPCGLDSGNLPIGVQLIGKPFAELDILKVAYVLEDEFNFDHRKMTAAHGH